MRINNYSMRNNNLTNLDTDQIIKLKFDQKHDADRVILVGGEKLNISIDSDKIANAVKEGLKTIDFSMSQNGASEIQYIDKQLIVPQIEYRTIEIPVVFREIEYREIERPIIVEKIVTIEKPVVIKEIEFKEIVKERHYPFIIKLTSIVQAICVIGLLLFNIFKK